MARCEIQGRLTSADVSGMTYEAMLAAVQQRADDTGLHFRITGSMFGWDFRPVPRRSLHFGADLVGELISPTRNK